MVHKNTILRVLIVLLLACILTSIAAEADESVSLPDYGPQVFESTKQDQWFIDAKGTMPVITDEGEKREWLDRLGKCLGNSRDMHQYSKGLGGPMISYGVYIDGYAIVELDRNSPEKVNQSLIDEMYQIIDASCKQEGINDVPVVFRWGETPQEDSAESQIPGFTLPMLILSLLLLMEIKRKVF